MKLPSLGSPDRKTLVVLGAGATRGASFVGNAALPPPVDGDFFRILQMSETGRSEEGRQLLDHVRDVYGPALDTGMETVFTNLDAAATFHQEVKIDPGPVVQWPTRLIDAFRTVLPRLLGETVGPRCDFHTALAEQLGTIDTVISLNYDCLADIALCEAAGSRFAAARGGYGVEVGAGAPSWRGSARGRTPEGSITLLKLHGSLNWDAAAAPLRLRTDLYDPLSPGVVQPPLTSKPISAEPFRSVWREARRAVRTARRLILVGYSMPVADGLVRSLFSTDLQSVLQEVIIVEPDRATRDRHIDFFTRLAESAKVFVFSTFAEFAPMLS
jgi:hypothetical protein